MKLNLNAPTKLVFLISVIAFVLGLILKLFAAGVLSTIGFWVMAASFVLLALSTVLKGL